MGKIFKIAVIPLLLLIAMISLTWQNPSGKVFAACSIQTGGCEPDADYCDHDCIKPGYPNAGTCWATKCHFGSGISADYCGSLGEANSAVGGCSGGGSCTAAIGFCSGPMSCGSPGCDCNSGSGVCSACNEHGNPEGCCTDQYHYNCSWNGNSCTGDSSSYQCQRTCGSFGTQSDCTTNGCSWAGGDTITDVSTGIVCATQCTQQTGGTCNDSCGTQHTCNRQAGPSPTTIRGQKVLMPIDANDNIPTAASTPWNLQITLDSNAANSTANPYSFATTVAFHNLLAPIPLNYGAGYTKCTSDQTSCDASYHATTTPFPLGFAASGPISGIVSVTTAPASGYADVWFHYCDHTGDANWTDSSVCIPDTGSCGNGTKTQTDACGNSRIASCATACSFFQTFGGDVTFAGPLYDTPLPSSSYFISGR